LRSECRTHYFQGEKAVLTSIAFYERVVGLNLESHDVDAETHPILKTDVADSQFFRPLTGTSAVTIRSIVVIG